VEKYGPKDVKSIALHVGTRNATQVRTHAQKYYLRIDREKKRKEEKESKDKDGGAAKGDGISPIHPIPPSCPLPHSPARANQQNGP
jgi:hypothetical protein